MGARDGEDIVGYLLVTHGSLSGAMDFDPTGGQATGRVESHHQIVTRSSGFRNSLSSGVTSKAS